MVASLDTATTCSDYISDKPVGSRVRSQHLTTFFAYFSRPENALLCILTAQCKATQSTCYCCISCVGKKPLLPLHNTSLQLILLFQGDTVLLDYYTVSVQHHQYEFAFLCGKCFCHSRNENHIPGMQTLQNINKVTGIFMGSFTTVAKQRVGA